MKHYSLFIAIFMSRICFSEAFADVSKDLAQFKTQFPLECQTKTEDFEQNFNCVQNHFVLGGEPVNPKIINSLIPMISDSGNQVLSISLLDSQHSNRYFCENLSVSSEGYSVSNHIEKETFTYKLIGKTKTGVFVILTSDWGGGSGVFYELLLARVKKGSVLEKIDHKNQIIKAPLIVLETLGSFALGDRSNPEVSIQDNTIEIKTKDFYSPHEENTLRITPNFEDEKK